MNILDAIYEEQNPELQQDEVGRGEGEGQKRENDKTEGDERGKRKKKDLYALLKENHDKNETLGSLWGEVNRIPEWVNWEEVKRGQDVFYRYAGVALTSVGGSSFL